MQENLELLNAATQSPTRELVEKRLLKHARRAKGGCLELTKKAGGNGYCQVQCQNVTYPAHRLAYVLAYGPLEPKQCVLHTCDNPICIEPRHLRSGTKKANTADAVEKGRQTSFKLTKWQRAQAVSEYRSGWTTYQELAEAYGVNYSAIKGLVHRWKGYSVSEMLERMI